MDQANIVIIGGGVVGCAIARACAMRWSDVFLLEALPKLGMGTSSRNSGVVHSGIYYPPGSLKAKHCLRGNQLTYEFCAAHGVPHRRTGKLVIASSASELPELAALMENGRANGVEGLRIIDRAAIGHREPHVEGFQALDVPSTGIVASEDLVKAYARVAADHGAHIVTQAKVERLEASTGGIRVVSAAGDIEARCLVNSAGLFSDEVAAMLGSKMARHRIYPVRGEYCELVRAKQDWVRGLVYPLPHPAGLSLGVHLTKTVWGTVLVGPTARYIEDKDDYEGDREPIETFSQGAKLLLPEIEPSDLVPAYSGIRAKLSPPANSASSQSHAKGMPDFIIERDPEIPRAVHLMGIESPGLTSAPAIAEHVRELIAETLA
ncbi:MAG TPA: NAD(P)/FAD-dependent oxidoreductase [Candidatus Polarisedimenticolia bacterium]|nr:NAD(P)/FAD-dependent oxidoreductase [Candidatus Polarisedimenticolia bacterium]